MFLQLTIIEKEEQLEPILKGFLDNDIKGTTVIACDDELHSEGDENNEQQAIFSSFRMLFKGSHHYKKMIMTVVDNDTRKTAYDVVKNVLGDMVDNQGGMILLLPLEFAEGV